MAEITREFLAARLAELAVKRAELQAASARLAADLNAHNGAMQLCEQLIQTIDAAAPSAAEEGDPTDGR